jgi:hypothetical protein
MDLTKREDQEGWSALERLLQIARRDTGQSQVETEYRRMRRVAVCAGCGNEVSLTFGNRLRTRREESRGYDKTKRLWMAAARAQPAIDNLNSLFNVCALSCCDFLS